MMRATMLMVFAGLLGAEAAGQGERVWPIPYQSRPGEAAQSAPFSISGARTTRASSAITTVDARSVPFGAGSTIDELAFRRDAVFAGGYAAVSGTVEVRIGTTTSAEDPHPSPQFVVDGALVAYRGPLSLPAAAPPSSGPAPFSVVIPFTTPWVYPGGDFAFQIRFEGPAGTVWRRDAVHVEDGRDGGFATRGGHGVVSSDGFAQQTWIEPERAVPGGELVVHLEGAPTQRPYGAAINLLGTHALTSLGQPLPIALPAPMFPAGSEIRIDIVDWQIQLIGDHRELFSRTQAAWPIPAVGALAGMRLTTQWLVFDPRAQTPSPLLTSDALEVTLGVAATSAGTHYGRSLWQWGATGDVTAGLERGPRNYVPVTRFGGSFAP